MGVTYLALAAAFFALAAVFGRTRKGLDPKLARIACILFLITGALFLLSGIVMMVRN